MSNEDSFKSSEYMDNIDFLLDLRSRLTEELKKNGIQLRYETEISSVEKMNDDSYRVHFQRTNDSTETNLVMFAIGRKPATENLGLDKVGIKTNSQGVILVDDYSQTNIPNIYAVRCCSFEISIH